MWFLKGFSAQHCLFVMLEKWKKAVDTKNVLGIFWQISQKFPIVLPHDLITAKLNAYRFSLSALKLSQNYLANRKERTTINDSYISWSDILYWIAQGSVLGPLLFNYLILVVQDVNITSYADDNTLYVSCNTIGEVILSLQSSSKNFFQWLLDN